MWPEDKVHVEFAQSGSSRVESSQLRPELVKSKSSLLVAEFDLFRCINIRNRPEWRDGKVALVQNLLQFQQKPEFLLLLSSLLPFFFYSAPVCGSIGRGSTFWPGSSFIDGDESRLTKKNFWQAKFCLKRASKGCYSSPSLKAIESMIDGGARPGPGPGRARARGGSTSARQKLSFHQSGSWLEMRKTKQLYETTN